MTREELITTALAILRARHQERYGIDAVDEVWLGRLSDEALELIISPPELPFMN